MCVHVLSLTILNWKIYRLVWNSKKLKTNYEITNAGGRWVWMISKLNFALFYIKKCLCAHTWWNYLSNLRTSNKKNQKPVNCHFSLSFHGFANIVEMVWTETIIGLVAQHLVCMWFCFDFFSSSLFTSISLFLSFGYANVHKIDEFLVINMHAYFCW